ncbi:hypothetical protein HOD75_01420 [archaeon]|jgi:hypothetical protein|nr:hypothetical protein [archaeon]MBT4241537.1 hypothetical protein [archaeon]MBT4417591.1 hypothetical protein [archaeon]
METKNPTKRPSLKKLITQTILDASELFDKGPHVPHVRGCTIVDNLVQYGKENIIAKTEYVALAVRQELAEMVSAGQLSYDFCADHKCYGLVQDSPKQEVA